MVPYPSNGPSYDPVISADGSTVAFVSGADNLSYDVPYYDELDHLYLYNVATGSISVGDVSSSYDLANGSASGRPALSADGDVVAFTSEAENLDPETFEASQRASRLCSRLQWRRHVHRVGQPAFGRMLLLQRGLYR